MQVHHNPTI